MVHLVTALATINPSLTFRIIQLDAFPDQARIAGVVSTPALITPGLDPKFGNLPPAHLAFYLWQAATQSL
ncbi:MAG: hypothetical protein C7B45_16910 [Sulfobacillus acidophilus]|uniref:Thioredoxin-like fold domain-containing protein n=1 Tax=Sulfobacillus acidophilus TaxID=53633 RepID=A0A2T2WCT2_9FIRM|nr:MAG: hypothetical protein C7B45_16910 [Sulfobacillus acidophilus]